jgi:hypothetical protein
VIGLPALARWAAAACAAALGGFLLARHPVVEAGGAARAEALAAFRVAFGLLLAFRLHRLRRAVPVLWPSQRASPWDRRLPLGRAIDLWQVSALALAAGLFTPLSALLCLALGLYVFRRSYTHSLEDVLFELNSFFLILADAGATRSIDALLGLRGAVIDPGLALNLWWIALALVLLSAGFEKLFSPLWRRGLGFSLFVGLPHLVQRRFRFLRGMPALGWLLSWTTVVVELAFLPSGLALPLRLALTCVLVGFACSLFLVVDISFIGQTLLLDVVLFGGLDLMRLFGAAEAAPPRVPGLAASCLLVGLAAIPTLAAPLGRVGRALERVARYTVGLEPIRVFTDSQLHGIYLYRVAARREDGGEVPLVRTFLEDGSSGPLQRWHSRVFLKMTYEVTDLCRIAGRDGWSAAEAAIQFQAACDLLRAGHAELGRLDPAERGLVGELVLSIRPVELDGPVDGPVPPRFSVGDWHPLLAARVCDGRLERPRLLALPARPLRTARR